MVTALAVLACPVGMGLMMLFMARGMRERDGSRREPSLDDLRAEHRRISAELARHGDPSEPARGARASS